MPIIPNPLATDPSIYVRLRKQCSLPGLLEASTELVAMMAFFPTFKKSKCFIENPCRAPKMCWTQAFTL